MDCDPMIRMYEHIERANEEFVRAGQQAADLISAALRTVAAAMAEVLSVLAEVRAMDYCSDCGRHFVRPAGEARPLVCCGREAMPVPLCEVAPGTPVYWPGEEMFADAPAIVEDKPRE